MANRQEEGRFMTTAEISDKLVSRGSIKKPMSMVQLGMLLRRMGYQSKQIGSDKNHPGVYSRVGFSNS